jgi:hypothetical protein
LKQLKKKRREGREMTLSLGSWNPKGPLRLFKKILEDNNERLYSIIEDVC